MDKTLRGASIDFAASTESGAKTTGDGAPAAAGSSDIAIDLTTEVRWFFGGRIAPEVLTWFTREGPGLREERSDSYRLDGQADIGVKRRFGTTLELKLRLGPPEPFVIGRDLEGRLETWQRWSPANGRVSLSENTRWIEIDKAVIKRRFDPFGRELPLSEETRAMEGEGCDVEVVAVSVAGRTAWTFAFAAFGPLDCHRVAIGAAWQQLLGGRPPPRQLRLTREASNGYPEWLVRVAPAEPGDRPSAPGASSIRFSSYRNPGDGRPNGHRYR